MALSQDEITAIAKETALIIMNAQEAPAAQTPDVPSEATQALVSASTSKEDVSPQTEATTAKNDAQSAVEGEVVTKEEHTAAFTQEQVVEILNNIRLKPRSPRKYGMIKALEAMFKEPAVKMVINGKMQALVSAEQMEAAIIILKANGDYWPKPSISATFADGREMFLNCNASKELGMQWVAGPTLVSRATGVNTK